MRIIAIRGQNLASLCDRFEVDFEAEPIRSSGIFAITGPTGAGKTTILDAICLALFDKLPRMDSADSGASIGPLDGDSEQQTRYDDVRGILRHGAGAGYAEVDFVGQDNRKFRSRWEVKRARGKARGKLQNQKITLTEIESGEVIGDKKTDTLHEIEKRIGLSFEQFRRSVLLAQGDFDTFIKAGSKDRAELLERITGTEIYSRISQAAFARAKEERVALRDLETQLGEHHPLSDEERAVAEERINVAKSEVDCIETERSANAKAQEWYDTKTRLDTRVAEATAALTQAEEADQAADADRATVATATKAFSLRAELEAAATSGRKLVVAEKTLTGALEAAGKAGEDRDRAVSAAIVATTERDEQRAAYDAIGPELDKAQKLDAVIETVKSDLATRKTLLEKSDTERDTARKAVAGVEAARQSAGDQRANDHRWFEEHESVEALSVRIEDVAKDLSERLVLGNSIASTSETVARLERQVTVARTSRLGKEAAVAGLQNQERELDERIAVLRKVADAIDTPALEVKRDAVVGIQRALENAQRAAGDAGKSDSQIVTADQEAAAQEVLVRTAGAAIANADAEIPTDLARFEEARHSLDLSEAAGSEAAEHLRLKLQEGQPCPVCGATEHPVTDVDRLLRDRATTDQKRVAELESKLSASRTARARAEAQLAAANVALQGISRRKTTHEGELQTARENWRASVDAVRSSCDDVGIAAPTFLEDAAAAGAAEAISPIREMLDKILAQTKETIKLASDAEVEARKLSSERETVRTIVMAASGDIGKLRDDENTKAREIVKLGAILKGAEQNLAAVCTRLDTTLAPVVPDWREKAIDLSEAFAQLCRDLVDDWRKCRKRIETADVRISSLDGELEGKRAALNIFEAGIGEAQKQHTEKKLELESLAAARLTIIGGRPAGQVRTEYRTRSEAAEKAWIAAEATKSKAEQNAAVMSANVISAREALNGASTDHEFSESLLAGKLGACGISREQAELALAKGEKWIAIEQARLTAIRETVTTAKTTLTDRKQLVEEHEATGRPERTREGIALVLKTIEERRAKASKDLVEASSVIRNDEQARSRIAEIKASLGERREKARVWSQLDDLIGSADGTNFRRFAQSLTLTHLIRLANHHLADLQPRYELQRAPGSELVLQVVDRNMADEVRGVHNLSGGERFLVSLALALGLASMSSNRGIKVESLFIDEGFGALDTNSLGMAVSVLEQLQATGRRIGVISHIDELKERIAVKVEVTPVGSGRSTVRIVTE